MDCEFTTRSLDYDNEKESFDKYILDLIFPDY